MPEQESNVATQGAAAVSAEINEFESLLQKEFRPKTAHARTAVETAVRTLAEQWVPRRSHAAFAWWWSLSAARGHTTPPP